jgi:hypothetical protein
MKMVFDSHGAVTSTEVEGSQSTASAGANNNSNVTPEAYQSTQASTDSTTLETVPVEESSTHVVQDLLAEGSARLEAHKREQDAKEKAKRIAEAKARKAALEEAPDDSKKSADMKYALMQKKRQQDAREERARILKRVEDDKAERREREAQRKAQIKAMENSQPSDSAATTSSIVPSALSRSHECALQIRLFDGSTIRSRFSSQGSLRADVRPWIDKQQSTDIPYTFKRVLTPLPNKNISISEEEQSLQSQGLAPSATLILVAVNDYTSAYKDSSTTGYVSRALTAGYGLVYSGVGLVTGVLGSILAGGPAQASPAADPTPIQPTPASNINVRTLREQDMVEDHQFYNGNAVSPAAFHNDLVG